MAPAYYFVGGASRGIGRGIVAHYLAKPDNVVIAGVRNPEDETSRSLSSLPTGAGSKLIVVKLDSTSDTDAPAAISKLESEHGVTALDVVVANAGIGRMGRLLDSPLEHIVEQNDVNVLGPLRLLQASAPLLKKAAKPRFVVISSAAGSVASVGNFALPNGSYSASKAAINSLTRKVHFEEEWLIAFPLHPGFVATDMGNAAAKAFGLEEYLISTEDSIAGIADLIDTATRETGSGPFLDYARKEIPW